MVDPPPPPSQVTSRRSVLKRLGLGGATILVAATGIGGYRVFDSKVLDPGGGPAYDPWRHWRQIPGPLGAVGAGILAASPHNSQPWVFGVTDTAIDLYVDAERNLGSIDPLRREQHVGLGCALENVALAARARGLAPVIELLPDGPSGERVAQVSLSPATPVGSGLYQ